MFNVIFLQVQSKEVGKRMTNAMESALKQQQSFSSSSSIAPPVACAGASASASATHRAPTPIVIRAPTPTVAPAVNPFSRVVSTTPAKAATATGTAVIGSMARHSVLSASAQQQQSQPRSASNSSTQPRSNNNIVKSRTVTSFVSSSSSSSCGGNGHNNLSSFVEKENAAPCNVSSFIKSVDAVVVKPRSVVMTAGM